MTGRSSLRHSAGLSAVAVATTWVAMLSWHGFAILWGQFMSPLLFVGAVIVGAGALARRARIPAWTVPLAQLVAVLAALGIVLVGTPVPWGHDYQEIATKVADAALTANKYPAPLPPSLPSIAPLLILIGAGAMLLVDVLACTLRRVSLAGLPLLALYCVPVSLLGGQVSWLLFATLAAGFLLMLFLQENDQISRWGRPLGETREDTGFGVRTGASRTTATTVGGIAAVLAVLLPSFVPTLHLDGWGFGAGTGDGNIKIENPTTDLRRDLVQGRDRPLVRITTPQPDPSYLRIAVLTHFSNNEWSPGDRHLPTDQVADGTVPTEQGLSVDVPTKNYPYTVQVDDSFESRWLPTQAPVSSVTAPGDWRYDLNTMDFIAGTNDLSTAGITYQMTATVPQLTAAGLADSFTAPQTIQQPYTDLPLDMNPMVASLAQSVTKNAPTRFEKARALQRWFRTTGGFTYDTSVSLGNGTDDLVAFLTKGPDGRRGYCEQFASAMAVMARTLNIPARVAVGFLEPDPVGKDTYVYSSRDMHAWPELYFEGAGWVRFEPTPSTRAASVPQYTTQPIRSGGPSSAPSTAQGGKVPSESASPSPKHDQQSSRADRAKGSDGAGFPWVVVLVLLVVVALAVLLVLLPRGVRRRRREVRLAGGIEDAWVELRDTAVDLGRGWPAGRSPRETGDHLVQFLGQPVESVTAARPEHGRGVSPAAEEALDRLVRALEELRYAPDPVAGGSVRPDVETCLSSLEGGCSRRARRRAEWLPRSLFVKAARVPTQGGGDDESLALTGAGGVVDHVS